MFLGINTAPTITNLPLSSALSVPENGGLSASVYQVSVTDVDAGQTHTFYASYNPSTGSSLFTMNPTSKLFLFIYLEKVIEVSEVVFINVRVYCYSWTDFYVFNSGD